MKEVKKLAGETIIYGLSTIVPRFLNYLLLTPFYTRIFTKGEYGIVTELYAYVAFILVILTYGMETTSFRFASSEKNQRKVFSSAQFSVLISSLLFILLISLFNHPIASFLDYAKQSMYISWMGIIVAADAFMAIPFARLRQENKAIRFTLIKISSVVVNIAFNLLFLVYMPWLAKNGSGSFLLQFYNPDLGVGYAFIANLIASGFTFILLLPDILRTGFGFNTELFSRMLKYAWPLLIIGIAGMINDVSDKFLLKFLIVVPDGVANSGDYIMEQIGIYGANTKIAVLMTLFIQMFKFAAEPFFFAQQKESNANAVYASVMRYFVIFCLIIFLGVMLYLNLVKFFIDEKFHEGLRVVPLILLSNMFLGVFYNLSVWYKVKDLTLYGAVIAVSGAGITLLLNILLVPEMGYYGSAIARLACYTAMMIASFLWGRRFLKVPYNLFVLLKYFLVAILLFGISRWNTLSNPVVFYAVNTIILLAFLAFVWISERKNIRALI